MPSACEAPQLHRMLLSITGVAAVPRHAAAHIQGPQLHRMRLCLHCRAAQPRLDFSYFEYPDLATFEPTVTALLRFARAYRDRTGFAPGAFALYFVRRSGRRTNAQLNYGGDAGAPPWLPMRVALARIVLSQCSTTRDTSRRTPGPMHHQQVLT